MEGGPAILTTENINHQNERLGHSKSIPLANRSLRLLDFS